METENKVVLRYKTGWLVLYGFLVLLGLSYLIYSLFFTDDPQWIHFVQGFLLLFLGVYLLIFQYGRVHRGKIRRMDSFKKPLHLDQLTSASKTSGVYVLEAKSQEIAFNTRMMSKKSQETLEAILAENGYELT